MKRRWAFYIALVIGICGLPSCSGQKIRITPGDSTTQPSVVISVDFPVVIGANALEEFRTEPNGQRMQAVNIWTVEKGTETGKVTIYKVWFPSSPIPKR